MNEQESRAEDGYLDATSHVGLPAEPPEACGKRRKKKAAVAVARKLAVLLHKLWATGEVYDPQYNRKAVEAARGKGKGKGKAAAA